MADIEIDDIDYELADRIQDIVDNAPRGGLTPSQVARKAKVDTLAARSMLDWLVRHVHITADYRGAWTRYYSRKV